MTVIRLRSTLLSPLNKRYQSFFARSFFSDRIVSNTAEVHGSTNRQQASYEWQHAAAFAFVGGYVLSCLNAENYLESNKSHLSLCEASVPMGDQGDSEDEIDPYDNLPEEDEPTHCSICLTYRQGPCRPYWRKVEACTKDNELTKEAEKESKEEDEESGNPSSSSEEDEEAPDPPCLKYMLPWIDCASGYRNLYALIELDTNYTSGIADLEKDATNQACWASETEPKVDWTGWEKYILGNPDWKIPKKRKASLAGPNVSLWKTLDTSNDPEVVEVFAAVPTKEAGGDGVLECAYAVDQDGNVLGFSYGTKPSEVAKIDPEDDEQPKMVELKILLVPSCTRSIVVSAAYTQPPREGAGKKEELESHILKGRPLRLKKHRKL